MSNRTHGQQWFISMGIIPVLFITLGLGVAVSSSANFRTAIWVAYFGLAWLILSFVLYAKHNPAVAKNLSYYFVIVVLFGFISWIAFRPAPLSVIARSLDGDYPAGTEIAAIKWQPVFSDLRVVITNKSNEIYSDIDALIRTDLSIAASGYIAAFSRCSGEPAAPVRVASINLEKNGKTTVIPGGITGAKIVLAPVYHVHCDRLFAGDAVEIVMALIKYDLQRFGDQTAPKTKPSWVTGIINYDGIGHSRSEPLQACFIGACEAMLPPSDLSGSYVTTFPPPNQKKK